MHITKQMEEFSRAYIYAVASAAGYGYLDMRVDYDSVDAMVYAVGAGNTPRRPKVEIQLKCTARNVLTNAYLRIAIPKKNFDDLRLIDLPVPRIIVVLLTPPDCGDWIQHSEAQLALRKCGYWASLRGLPESPNTTSVTIRVPRAQQFTPAALEAMMLRIDAGGVP